jgi:hypothetical protein
MCPADADLTETIIGCASTARQVLGAGFPELVYEKVMTTELKEASPRLRAVTSARA